MLLPSKAREHLRRRRAGGRLHSIHGQAQLVGLPRPLTRKNDYARAPSATVASVRRASARLRAVSAHPLLQAGDIGDG